MLAKAIIAFLVLPGIFSGLIPALIGLFGVSQIIHVAIRALGTEHVIPAKIERNKEIEEKVDKSVMTVLDPKNDKAQAEILKIAAKYGGMEKLVAKTDRTQPAIKIKSPA